MLDDHNHSNPNNLYEDPDCAECVVLDVHNHSPNSLHEDPDHDDGKDLDPDDRNCTDPDDQYGSDHSDDVWFSVFFCWC